MACHARAQAITITPHRRTTHPSPPFAVLVVHFGGAKIDPGVGGEGSENNEGDGGAVGRTRGPRRRRGAAEENPNGLGLLTGLPAGMCALLCPFTMFSPEEGGGGIGRPSARAATRTTGTAAGTCGTR